MDEKQLQALANELAKNIKIPEGLNQFDRLLKKASVEAALNAERLITPATIKTITGPVAAALSSFGLHAIVMVPLNRK